MRSIANSFFQCLCVCLCVCVCASVAFVLCLRNVCQCVSRLPGTWFDYFRFQYAHCLCFAFAIAIVLAEW